MKTFYCVQTRFFNDGKIRAICYPIEGTEKPRNEFHSTTLNDVYCDYFDTYDEADKFRKSCEKA